MRYHLSKRSTFPFLGIYVKHNFICLKSQVSKDCILSLSLIGIEPIRTRYERVILPLNYRLSRITGFEPILTILKTVVLPITPYPPEEDGIRTHGIFKYGCFQNNCF